MENKKKIFLKPEAEIIDFKSDDVIRTSGGLRNGTDDTDWDDGGSEVEGF